MSDIGKELLDIQTNLYGIDIRMPIHDALAALAGADAEIATRAARGFPIDFGNADISAELQVIQSDPKGANVKAAIYSALSKLSQVVGQTNYISAGLTPQEIEVEPLSGAFLDKYHSTFEHGEPLEFLVDNIPSGLSMPAEFERIDVNHAEARFYDMRDQTVPFVKITEETVQPSEGSPLLFWRIHIYGYAYVGASEKSIIYSFPEDAPTSETTYESYPYICPEYMYISSRSVCIRLGGNANHCGWMVFDRCVPYSGYVVSFNCGFDHIVGTGSEYVDISSKIRSFSSNEVYSSIQSEITQQRFSADSDYLALASLLCTDTQTTSYARSSYVSLAPLLTGNDVGIVTFGTRKYFLTNSFMIEA